MSGWDTALQTLSVIGTGAGGVAQGLQFNEEQRYKYKALEAKQEIERLQNDIRLMLESLKDERDRWKWQTPSANVHTQEEGQTARTTQTNQTREDIATLLETGRNDRWDRPSGNVLTQQEGANTRLAEGVAQRQREALMRDRIQNRRVDVEEALGLRRDATQRYGIDTTASTSAAGRASAAEIAAKNRASREQIETERNKSRNYGALGGVTPPVFGRDREGLPPLPVTPRADMELKSGTGKPETTPVEVVNPPVDQPPPRSPEASTDQLQRIGGQLQAAIQRLRAATKPDEKARAATELKRLRDRYAELLAKLQRGG